MKVVFTYFVAVFLVFLIAQAESHGNPNASDHVDAWPPSDVNSSTALHFDKVQVDIYYEAFCDDSRHFIKYGAFILNKWLGDISVINLIPFGKSRVTAKWKGKWDFACHFGNNECYVNILQACAISLFSFNDSLIFVDCLAWYPLHARFCAKYSKLDWDKLVECANGTEGNRLYYENGQKTTSLDPPLTFTPWIVINGVWTLENQRVGYKDIRIPVCRAYQGYCPHCVQVFMKDFERRFRQRLTWDIVMQIRGLEHVPLTPIPKEELIARDLTTTVAPE